MEGRWGLGRLAYTAVLGIILLSGWRSAVANEVVNWNNTALSVLIAAGNNNVTVTRGLTMVHIAMHDALNTIQRRYEGYVFQGPVEGHPHEAKR